MKIIRLFLLAAALACLTAGALAETAWVQTPGGPLNMRRKQNGNSTVVAEVVEAEEIGDTWSKITYKKKSGYVKTQYLLLASSLAGKTVYPGDGAVLAYAAPDADARILFAFNADDPLQVERVEGDWAAVDCAGQTGYAQVSALMGGRETPGESLAFIAQSGVVEKECALQLTAAERGGNGNAARGHGGDRYPAEPGEGALPAGYAPGLGLGGLRRGEPERIPG